MELKPVFNPHENTLDVALLGCLIPTFIAIVMQDSQVLFRKALLQ